MIEDRLINKEEFQLALVKIKKKEILIANRIFDLFDIKYRGVLDFGDFVLSLNVFHPNSPLEDKINFLFTLYDLESTGCIERQEVKQMLIASLCEYSMKLPDRIVEILLDKMFLKADVNQDGKIDKTEWQILMNNKPSLLKIISSVSKGFESNDDARLTRLLNKTW